MAGPSTERDESRVPTMLRTITLNEDEKQAALRISRDFITEAVMKDS